MIHLSMEIHTLHGHAIGYNNSRGCICIYTAVRMNSVKYFFFFSVVPGFVVLFSCFFVFFCFFICFNFFVSVVLLFFCGVFNF